MSELPADAARVEITGTVTRTFNTKNGRAHEVEVRSTDREHSDRYTVWGDLDVPDGVRVTVRGFLSVRAELFEGRYGQQRAGVKRSVNAPRLVAVEHTDPTPGEGGWNVDDNDTPF